MKMYREGEMMQQQQQIQHHQYMARPNTLSSSHDPSMVPGGQQQYRPAIPSSQYDPAMVHAQQAPRAGNLLVFEILPL